MTKISRKKPARKGSAPQQQQKTAGPTLTHTLPDGRLASAGIRAGDSLHGRRIDEDDLGLTGGELFLLLLDAGGGTETAAGYYESISEEEDSSCTTFRLRTDDDSRIVSTGEVIGWYRPAEVRRDLQEPIRLPDEAHGSPKLTQEEAEALAEGEGFRSAMEDETGETVILLALLEFIAEEPDDAKRGSVYLAAYRGAAPIFVETEKAVREMRARALGEWRARRAGAAE